MKYVKNLRKNGKCFLWPTKDDPCWVPLFNCLRQLDSLLVHINFAHTYSISNIEHNRFNFTVLS